MPAKRPEHTKHLSDLSLQPIPKLPRRHSGPAFERAAEATGVGETQQITDLTQRTQRVAQMQQRQVLPTFVEQRIEPTTFVRQVPLQAAQTQVQRMGNAFGRRFAFRQLLFNGVANLALPGQEFELRQGSFEHGFVVLGEFRVGVVQMAVEVQQSELQSVFIGVEITGERNTLCH